MTRGGWLLPFLLAGCTHPPPPAPVPLRIERHDADPIEFPEDGAVDLRTVLALTLARNSDLAVTRLEPVAALAELERERAAFRPELFGEAAAGGETSSETARSTGERFSVDADSRETEVGVRKALSTGGEVAMSVAESRDASNRAPTQQEVRAGIDLTQPLLRGRGPDAALVEVRAAEIGVDISREELRAYAMALVARAETDYWRYVLAVEAVAITQNALEVAERQLEDIRQRIEVGQVAPNQLAAAEAEVARRRQDLIDARAAEQRNRLRLLGLMSVDNLERDLKPLTRPDVTPDDLDAVDALTDTALALRPELREARLRAQQNRLETVATRNGLLPRLDFFAALAKTGFGEDLDQARNGFTDDNTYEWTAGIRVLKELGISAGEAEYDLARVRLTQAELAIENLERRIRTEVRIALVELDRASRQIEASAETRRLRELTAEAERERFEVGAGTALLVSQAQRDLLESRIDELRATVVYQEARVALRQALGTTLDRHGVRIGDAP